MNYILVSLVGDDDTKQSDEFAVYFEKNNPAYDSFHEENPDHDQVKKRVEVAKVALVFGHNGGGSIRAFSDGRPWAEPKQFVDMFKGSRVWVYACRTRGKKLGEDIHSFGREVFEGGVSVFVGYCSVVAAPLAIGKIDPSGMVREGLARAFRAFLQGENSADNLRKKALSGRGRSALIAAPWLDRDMKNLRDLVSV